MAESLRFIRRNSRFTEISRAHFPYGEREAWSLFRNPLPAAAENEVIFGFVREAIQLPPTPLRTQAASATSMTRSAGTSSWMTC